MIVALAALFFAMTGFGIAAKNQITGKDIKDGSITSRDLAKGAVKAKHLSRGAVKAKHLAKRAVKGDAIAPNAVGASAIAANAVQTRHVDYKVCPNGVLVPAMNSCPSLPDRHGRATDVAMAASYPMPATSLTCYFGDVTFTETSSTAAYSPAQGASDKIPVTQTGTYDIKVNGTWETGPGELRSLSVSRHLGSGPNQGQHSTLEQSIDRPVAHDRTSQSFSLIAHLEQGDHLTVGAATCGESADANVKLEKVSISMTRHWESGDQ